MQYILSEQEYIQLKSEPDVVRHKSGVIIQQLCTQVANHMPVPRPWAGKDAEPKPWGCILTPKELTRSNPGYCDDCPVTEICPHGAKRWSK